MTQRIVDSLTAHYTNHAVVFWHDADGEFHASVDGLTLPDGQLVQLDLDDRVKVNYGKVVDLLAEVKAVTGGAGDE